MNKYVIFEKKSGAVRIDLKAYLRSPEYQRKRQEMKALLRRQHEALRFRSTSTEK